MRNAKGGWAPACLLAAAVSLAGCGESPWVPVDANIYLIDRSCEFVVTESRDPFAEGASTTGVPIGTPQVDARKYDVRATTDDCHATDEFAKIQLNPKGRVKDIKGKATVRVTFKSPIDQSVQTGSFDITGKDDEFYMLKANETIKIRVDKRDHSKIRYK